MLDVKLRRKFSKATIVLINNPLDRNILSPRAHSNKTYLHLGKRLFRLALFADALYYECLIERSRMSGPKREFIAMQFEVFFLYLRTIYDYLAVVIDNEIGDKKMPHNFHKFLKQIKGGKLNKVEKNMQHKFVNFMHGEYFFKMKDIRDSIKMKNMSLNVVIKNSLIHVENENNKINDTGVQLIFNHCWMTAGWMIVINDLINSNKPKDNNLT